MKDYKRTGLQLAVLVVLQGACLQTTHSQDPAGRIKDQLQRQQAIYHGEVEGYTVDRGLAEYTRALSPEFDRSLAALGPEDRWLDVGAGQAQAILDYHTLEYDVAHPEGRERRGKKARAVAISIEDRRTPAWNFTATRLGDRITYLASKRLRQYAPEELGRFQVITDVAGGFSYTDNIAPFLERILSLLELSGSFYTMLQDVHSKAGTNKPYYAGSPFLTEIENPDGSPVKVCTWLKSVTCVKVTCELKPRWTPPIEAFHVQKVCND